MALHEGAPLYLLGMTDLASLERASAPELCCTCKDRSWVSKLLPIEAAQRGSSLASTIFKSFKSLIVT